MDLILWRHAEAEDGSLTLPDAQRQLTERGQKQAKRMASWLRDHLPKSARILVSPAMRTQQTVHPLMRAYETEPAIAVGASVDDVLRAAGWPAAPGTVLVVGHQPTLGLVAARLIGETNQEWSVKKGAVWWIGGRERHGQAQCVLRAVVNPDFL